MRAEFKIASVVCLFVALCFYFYTLCFPLRETLGVLNQKSRIEFNTAWQNDSFIDISIFARASNITLFYQNAPVAKLNSLSIVNLGFVAIGVASNLTPIQKIVDFSVDKIFVIYTPLMPKTVKIYGYGDFGSLSGSVNSSLLSLFIKPSERFSEFKSSLLGSKILSSLKPQDDGFGLEYAY
ncbi:MAG: hypothetical protein RL154_1076 [Pseudomonadota bacterium]